MKTVTDQRFGAMLSRNEPREIWDTVVLDLGTHLVAPTMGSIAPLWFLLVPKEHSLNFGQRETEVAPFELARMAVSRLGFVNSHWVWFEHGAADYGSKVGCGVDHAHLHFIVNPTFNLAAFRDVVFDLADEAWVNVPSSSAYEQLSGDASYYVFGDSQSAFVRENGDLGSQFFRKVVAELMGAPALWDYRAHPFRENVVSTLDQLRQCLVAAE